MNNQRRNDTAITTRRNFITGMAGIIAASSISVPALSGQTSRAQISQEDPGVSFTLSPSELERAAALLRQVFTPFMGEWIGTREGKDTGSKGPVLLNKTYSLYIGGPQVVADVEALVGGVSVFRAAKHYVGSPSRDTLLTYFFETGANVQIFELDRKALDQDRLVWNEILRKGRLFRAEESFPKADEWTSTIYQQDSNGKYQVFAANQLRRKYKESYRRQKG
jgi:hypothetical protein